MVASHELFMFCITVSAVGFGVVWAVSQLNQRVRIRDQVLRINGMFRKRRRAIEDG
jgi:hypothetical protein